MRLIEGQVWASPSLMVRLTIESVTDGMVMLRFGDNRPSRYRLDVVEDYLKESDFLPDKNQVLRQFFESCK